MNTLQIIIISASIILAVAALLIFAGILPGFRASPPGEAGEILFWGTIPQTALAPLLSDFGQRFQNIKITYRQFDEENYINELIDAIAGGKGPDVFSLPQEQIVKQKDKILFLTPEVYPLKTFRDNFIDLAEIYIRPEGIAGLPFVVDPLVLYWNRDLFANAGLAKAPVFWDEFQSDIQKLRIVEGQKIKQAGAALGEFKNIKNAKGILSALILQTGNKITDSATLKPVFNERDGNPLSPMEDALLFFAGFADPRKDTFSWSQAMPEALDAFGSGSLAMHLGYASDLAKILAKNPHLNLGLREIPQIRGGRLQTTYARSWALALTRGSKNIPAALTFIFDMASPNQQTALAKTALTPPVLRSLVGEKPKDPALEIFYQAAIRSRAWLDPDPMQSEKIWRDAASAVLAGSKSPNEAASAAAAKFNSLISAD